MKVIAIFAIVVAVAFAAPQGDRDANVVKSELENIGVDGYHYEYETSNGIHGFEEGHIQNPGSEAEEMTVKGFYEYKDADNKPIRVDYTADKDGYHATGEHLP